MNNNFNDKMFNPLYDNSEYNDTTMKSKEHSLEQEKKVADAVKAIHDLCEAVKGMDSEHQKIAFSACFSEMAKEMKW